MEQYMFNERLGKQQIDASSDPCIQKGIALWLKRVDLFYQKFGGGVDVEVINDMLLPDVETAPSLYSKFTEL